MSTLRRRIGLTITQVTRDNVTMAFVKLDCGMLDSSIWPDKDARDIFITALLMALPHETTGKIPQIKVRSLEETGWLAPPDWYGLVRAAGVGIVRRCGIDQEAGLAALERLGEPDPDSRSDDHEGRRLIRIDGGYLVLNFERYRKKDHTAAARATRYRLKKQSESRVTNAPSRVTSRSVTQAEAEAEADKNKKEPYGRRFAPPDFSQTLLAAEKVGLPRFEAEKFFNFYSSKNWMVGKNKMQSMPHALAGWKSRWEAEGRPNNGKPRPKSIGEQDLEKHIAEANRLCKEEL